MTYLCIRFKIHTLVRVYSYLFHLNNVFGFVILVNNVAYGVRRDASPFAVQVLRQFGIRKLPKKWLSPKSQLNS